MGQMGGRRPGPGKGMGMGPGSTIQQGAPETIATLTCAGAVDPLPQPRRANVPFQGISHNGRPEPYRACIDA